MVSMYLKLEGSTVKNRIWDFLIVYSEFDYSMKDIARYSKVSYTALKEVWKEFADRKIVVFTRNVGKAKMYRLNVKNPVVKKFIDFYWAVIENEIKGKEKEDNKAEVKEDFGHSAHVKMAMSAKSI